MDIGIALDGTGRLGRLSAVTTLARAADRLGYRSAWCNGPMGPMLVGAVAAATSRLCIGLESRVPADVDAARVVAGDRLVVVAELPPWPPASARGPGRVDVDVGATSRLVRSLPLPVADWSGEVVVRLLGDPGVDEALAAYAELGELAEGLAGRWPTSSQHAPS